MSHFENLKHIQTGHAQSSAFNFMYIYPNWNDHVLCPCKGKDEPKLYIPSTIKTQINLVLLLFWADWAVRALLKISAVLLKYPTFEVVSYFCVPEHMHIF